MKQTFKTIICNLLCGFNTWEARSGSCASYENLNASLLNNGWSVCDNDSINVKIQSHISDQMQTAMVNLNNVSFKENGQLTCMSMGKYREILYLNLYH